MRHKTAVIPCPSCDESLNGHTGIVCDDAPKPNDYTICIYCSALLAYNADLSLRAANAQETAEIMSEPSALEVLEALRATLAARQHLDRGRLLDGQTWEEYPG